MDSYENLPDFEIKNAGRMSNKFLDLGIKTFKEACEYVHNMEYGYNTNYEDEMILFKECKGTCTTKHGVIALLAKEHDVPLFRYVGIYKFTEDVSSGANNILKKYNISYILMIHGFLIYKEHRFDLTEGNKNGKKTAIDKFIDVAKVEPFLSPIEEYLILKKTLKEKILPSKEIKCIPEKILLKAREEAILLLKKNIQE